MSAEAPLYDVHILLQPCASMPDGPAEPVVLNAADLMVLASIESKITGWIGWGSEFMMHSVLAGWPRGCLLFSASLTVGES